MLFEMFPSLSIIQEDKEIVLKKSRLRYTDKVKIKKMLQKKRGDKKRKKIQDFGDIIFITLNGVGEF